MSHPTDNRKRQEEEVNDSKWLFEVLQIIGANDEYRKTCQRQFTACDIIGTVFTQRTTYQVGSTADGTVLPGVKVDWDYLICVDVMSVIQDISEADQHRFSLLIVRESETPAGYVKLQCMKSREPCTFKHWPNFINKFARSFKIDRFGKMVLNDFIFAYTERIPYFSRGKNKPAATFGYHIEYKNDFVLCYRCTQWPMDAQEWLNRRRCNGWPTTERINELKSLGFFLVKKGHPFSSEQDLEWRISFTLQERNMVFNLTDIQYKCYVVLKMINRDIINLECITTYHWKTCLFYVIEENQLYLWESKRLFHCVKLCIQRMLVCVRRGFCPDYFVFRENLFEGRLTPILRPKSEKILVKLLDDGFCCLRHVKSNNICEYVKSRTEFVQWDESLQADSLMAYKEALYTINAGVVGFTSYVFNLCQTTAYNNNTNLIEFLWRTLNRVQQIDTILEYTLEETQHALSLMTPLIYTSLASNISAKCIQESNLPVRDFLLFGSYTYFMKGDLNGYLKFISVLYAVGCFKDCEWYLRKLGRLYEGSLKKNPSVCLCHILPGELTPMANNIDISQLRISTCILFMPTELPLAPDALKYEFFKYVGIPLEKSESKIEFNSPWHHGAVVDSNIYYSLLRFLIKKKFRGLDFAIEDMHGMVVSASNVRHREVAFNLRAWILSTLGLPSHALSELRCSWLEMNSLDLGFLLTTQEMKKKQYQFNSAKLHALVVVYNTWFTKKPPKFPFCFQCFGCRDHLQKCSRCKTATYCSQQCQIVNWKIHRAVCKIVRKYHHV